MCLFLVLVLLLSWSPIRVQAMAGGGVIGGASAGLALSPGMVGLLLLGAFGVYYLADNEDAIGRSLEIVLEAEATNTELSLAAQAEYAAALTSWWESAKAGSIDLVSAPAWLQDVITGWAGSFIDGSTVITGVDPSCGVVSDSVLYHTGRVFHVVDASSPVFYQFYCTERKHSVFFFSNSKFSAGTALNSLYVAKIASGSNIYYHEAAYSTLNGSMSFGPECNVVDTIPKVSSIQDTFSDMLSNGLPTVPIYPEVITGGISDQLSNGIGMDVIGLPDIVIPGPDVLPVKPSEGQTTAQAVTDYLMAALIAGDITWEQYWQLIGVYNPAIGSSVPTVGTVDPVTGTITNTEISTGVVVTPSPITNFHVDLTSFFPFCIPFDFYEFIRILCAEPEAPVFHWEVQDLSGNVYSVDVDLSPWNPHAQLFRDAQCLLFIIGLLMLTRKFIKW